MRKLVGKSGIVLPLVLTYAFIFTAQLTGLTEYASHATRLVQSEQYQLKNHYLAEAAIEKAFAAIRLHIQNTGTSPSAGILDTITQAPNISSSGVTYGSTTTSTYSGGGAWTTKTLTSGDYAGLNASTQTINIAVATTDTKNGVTHHSTVNQSIEVQLIPIFQFGVFYQNDLEILPGANMTFSGPVHTNANLYLATNNTKTLSFDSHITSVGTIRHTRKDGSAVEGGDVRIKNDSSVYQNMKLPDGSWLDSNHASWSSQALSRWDNNVLSGAHGVKSLTLPLPTSAQAHTLIERRTGSDTGQTLAQKMDTKAHLRILDGVVQDQVGNVVELRYCSGGGSYTGSCPSGQTVVNPLSSTTFYNYREGKTVKSTDVDVAKLKNSPAFNSIVASQNGVIVYFSDRRNQGSSTFQDSVRLVNGSSLPTKGMTFASENPLYVKGNYNTVSKQPSGLVADAFNVLSNNWNDANSTNTSLSGKTATATTLNSTIITGNTETTTGQYNGGFENIHRLHENWSNVNFTYSGSVITLYNSQIATGNWIYGGNYYTAPNRVWSFDTDLSNPNYAIPGFPSVFNVAKVNYEVS